MKLREPQQSTTQESKRAWKQPTVTSAGTVSGILQGGHGKVSVTTGDPGEPHKIAGNDQ
ncbi:MAG: hypothetical protein ABI634_06705 [Acidobacteriota bacterium]